MSKLRDDNEPGIFYAVCRISDGEIVYRGDSLAGAAAAWVPGTCWGKGTRQGSATIRARQKSKEIQQRKARRERNRDDLHAMSLHGPR